MSTQFGDKIRTAAVELGELTIEAGIPAGVVNIVHGGGGEVGMAIVGHPDVDMVSFTGSTMVGKKISEVASATLKRVSLELGGKSAQLVMPDANLTLALEGSSTIPNLRLGPAAKT